MKSHNIAHKRFSKNVLVSVKSNYYVYIYCDIINKCICFLYFKQRIFIIDYNKNSWLECTCIVLQILTVSSN